MDETAATLQNRLDQLLQEAARVAVALDRANGTVVGIPHYSVIETRAHELTWDDNSAEPSRPGTWEN